MQTISTSDITIHIRDEGPRDGEIVVMLHGNPSWSYYWRHLVLGLRDRYRCIVPDHIGMGLSDKPDDAPSAAPRYDYIRRQELSRSPDGISDLDALVRGGGEDAPRPLLDDREVETPLEERVRRPVRLGLPHGHLALLTVAHRDRHVLESP